MKTAVFLYNPESGKGKIARNVGCISTIFQAYGYDVTPQRIDFTANPFDGNETIDLMVVAGGDGTVNYAVNAMKRKGLDIPIGVIPAGTANDFAGAVGMSREPLEAARQIASGSVERVARHADRPGEIIGRTGRNHADGNVQPLAFHGVDRIVHRAVAAGNDHQVDGLVAVERIGRKVDPLRRDVVAVGLKNRTDAPDVAGDFALARFGIVEEYRCFHLSRYFRINASMAGETYSSYSPPSPPG